ncbi:hypothetical protein AB0I54_12720 [Streptomyces sp. NPDC050625]|uniref:hypothetical protein n=1 Tax=Streptomyces sp. NPDC050625 TaxID=3154629 RepID=UPI00341A0EB8
MPLRIRPQNKAEAGEQHDVLVRPQCQRLGLVRDVDRQIDEDDYRRRLNALHAGPLTKPWPCPAPA